MNDKIVIKYDSLANYVMFKLDKIDNEFTLDELKSIDELVIDFNEETDSSFLIVEELANFNGINTITFRNGFIDDNIFGMLNCLDKLKDVTFDNCEFSDVDLIATLNLSSLAIFSCLIDNYSFIYTMKSLEKLTIVNGSVDISKINLLTGLYYLQLSYTNIEEIEDSINLRYLIELHIDNTNIKDLDFIRHLVNLRKLSIDENQYSNNKDLIKKTIDKGVLVYNEGMTLFGGEVNEV